MLDDSSGQYALGVEVGQLPQTDPRDRGTVPSSRDLSRQGVAEEQPSNVAQIIQLPMHMDQSF